MLGDFQLPDARPRVRTGAIFGPLGWMERVYCVNCGRDGGVVKEEWAAHVFYLCDACAQTHGRLELPQIPEELVRGA